MPFWGLAVQDIIRHQSGSVPGNPWLLNAIRPKGNFSVFFSISTQQKQEVKALPILSVLFIQGKLAFHSVSFFVPSAFSYRKLGFSQKREKYYTQTIGFHGWKPMTILLQSGVSTVSIFTNLLSLFPYDKQQKAQSTD